MSEGEHKPRFLFTTDAQIYGYRIEDLFCMVQYIARIDLGKPMTVQIDKAFDDLASKTPVPAEANAIIGIQVSTSTIVHSSGDAYLYLVYLGTPAKLVKTKEETDS